MMTITDVQVKADQVASVYAKIKSDRNYWKLKAQPLIIATLVRIREVTQLNFSLDNSTNEIVDFAMELNENEPIGQLFFVLTYDGHVMVYARYSTVEYAPHAKTTHYDRLSTVETTLVDESFVYEMVDKFLDTITSGYITKVSVKDSHNFY